MADGRRDHWDRIYTSTPSDGVSWYEPEASTSIDLITSLAGPAAGLIDVGAGASPLVRHLIDIGWRDLTVLDVSAAAVVEQTDRLGDRAGEVTMIVEDVLDWLPDRTYRVWHDRAVFHFLIDDADQIRYATTAAVAVEEGGHAVIGVFADDGPSTCSGLPTARYDADSLAERFIDWFHMVHWRRVVHRTPSGASQPFTWVVLERRSRPASER